MKLNNEENVDFGIILSKNGLNKTSFRKKLIELFYYSKSSLSIDEIINNISYKVDKVSVYRALSTFEENGLIHKVPDRNNLLRYALCQNECSSVKHSNDHAHLLCSKCNATYCLSNYKISIENKYKDFIINHSKIILEGNCIDCQ